DFANCPSGYSPSAPPRSRSEVAGRRDAADSQGSVAIIGEGDGLRRARGARCKKKYCVRVSLMVWTASASELLLAVSSASLTITRVFRPSGNLLGHSAPIASKRAVLRPNHTFAVR